MTKIALLVGVSNYEHSDFLKPLPSAHRDVEAMQRVLLNPQIGGFSEAVPLIDPDAGQMQEAIEDLFRDRDREDLVLLFFSGHGIKDDSGRLYFATRRTRKTLKGDLVTATAVPSLFVDEAMRRSRSKRQVVILDCCFSGAFDPALQGKDDGSVDLQTHLGAEGRVVLASSSFIQYSFEQKDSELSIYTRYLVEGIETGAADRDNDNKISVRELHEYASSKVQETAPSMSPKIIVLRDEGFDVVIAKAPLADPKLKYRREAERYGSQGQISPVGRMVLDKIRVQLGLSEDEVAAVEDEVLRPYRDRLGNLQQYQEAFIASIQQQYPPTPETLIEFKGLQEIMGLRDQDVETLQAEAITQVSTEQARTQQPLLESKEGDDYSKVFQKPDMEHKQEGNQQHQDDDLKPKQSENTSADDRQVSRIETLEMEVATKLNTLSSSSRKSRLLIGVGSAILFIGLIAGGSFFLWKEWIKQQQIALEQVSTSYKSNNYEQCIRQANDFTGGNLEIAGKIQKLFGQCQSAKEQEVVLEVIRNASLASNYDECIKQVETFPEGKSELIHEAEELMAKCQLAKAKQLAKQGKFVDAITIAVQISQPTSAYGEAQRLIGTWPQQILKAATNEYEQGNRSKAILIAQAVPESSSYHEEAVRLIAQWDKEWKENEQYAKAAQTAFDKEQWEDAITAASKVTTYYWKNKVSSIITRATKKQQLLRQGNREILRKQDTLNREYREYEFTVEARTTISVQLTSSDFDTVLKVQELNGREIALDDDTSSENYDSSASFVVERGTYRVRVYSYDSGRGAFTLIVRSIL